MPPDQPDPRAPQNTLFPPPAQTPRAFSPQLGTRFATRYLLIKPLGKGGMGSVWLANDQPNNQLSQLVALKFPSFKSFQDAASAIKRLQTETFRARALSHKNIVHIYDWVADPANPDACAISMEYVNGITLDDWRKTRKDGSVDENGFVDADDLLPVAEQICDALACAHQNGIIHRDLKPGNIMLRVDDEGNIKRRADDLVKIMDFGIASGTQKLTTVNAGAGTPGYMSLQQMDRRNPASPTDDIYSLGVVLYELLAGAHPYEWDHDAELISQMLQGVRPPSMTQRRLKVHGESAVANRQPIPEHWETTIAACLELDAAKRIQSAGEVLRLLQNAPRQRPKRKLVATGLAIIAIAAAAFFMTNPFGAKKQTREPVPAAPSIAKSQPAPAVPVESVVAKSPPPAPSDTTGARPNITATPLPTGASVTAPANTAPAQPEKISPQDTLRAKAEQGDADAQYNLGLMYYNGQGVPKDYAEAVKWYRQAADKNNVEACIALGRCYANGRGVPKDLDQARLWYQKANLHAVLPDEQAEAKQALKELDDAINATPAAAPEKPPAAAPSDSVPAPANPPAPAASAASAPAATEQTSVVTVSAGKDHSLCVTRDGTLWAMGGNSLGQLGLSGFSNREKHIPVQIAPNVAIVSAGYGHSLYITRDGTLWATGWNAYAQLGAGTGADRYAPVKIAANVIAVAAGSGHSLYVTRDGKLWGMGQNTHGELAKARPGLPSQIASNVIAVATGYSHSLYVTRDGKLWAMGQNDRGQLGDGTTIDRHKPVQIATDVAAVAVGFAHSLYLTRDGKLLAMGNNAFGQLGDGTTTDRHKPVQIATDVIAMAAGNCCSLYVTRDGALWTVGENIYGELGDGTTRDRAAPVQIDSGVIAVAAGENHNLYVTRDGKLWAMGNNKNGQLGDGATADRHTPVQIKLPEAAPFAAQSTPATPLPAPRGLAILDRDCASVSLGWVAPSKSDIIGYAIGFSDPSGNKLAKQTKDASIRIENLESGTEYTFEVSALHKNGGISQAVSITTATKSYKDALAGRWRFAGAAGQQPVIFELNADGTLRASSPTSSNYTAGTWKVNKRTLVVDAAGYTAAGIRMGDKSFADEIISIDKNRFVYTCENQQGVWTR